jgi:hypothetical protein
MKFLDFIFFMLCLLSGCFTIMCVCSLLNIPVLVSYIIGGFWGFWVGKDFQKRIKNE